MKLAKRLRYKMKPVDAQSVTLAGGNQLQCHYICKGFKWLLHGTEFEYDVMLLPLRSCDLELGI